MTRKTKRSQKYDSVVRKTPLKVNYKIRERQSVDIVQVLQKAALDCHKFRHHLREL